ncbi:hypothetical protein [Chitinophaga deserti]|uniref:hypothetical protein n=1 Tax=Chitinophaga deserti TaxID=2164099 RepID=UPI0013005B42|nr:hypothetical protein [Chitinophaga deserti]
MKKNVQKKKGGIKLKHIVSFLLFLFILGSLLFNIGKHQIAKYFLKGDVLYTRGVIIDEKNFSGNSPVSQEFSYSYVVIVNGKRYKNNSHDPKYKVGDSVEVKYSKVWPGFNRAVSNK